MAASADKCPHMKVTFEVIPDIAFYRDNGYIIAVLFTAYAAPDAMLLGIYGNGDAIMANDDYRDYTLTGVDLTGSAMNLALNDWCEQAGWRHDTNIL